MATFGELLAVADLHRSKAHEALQQADITTQASHPSSITELGRLTRVLIRYTDRIASGFGLPGDHGAKARGIARRAGTLLHQAGEALDLAGVRTSRDTRLADHLRASSVALGCGLDLLATHLPAPDQGRFPTSVAAVITAPDSAPSLFHLITQHAATAGRIAAEAGPLGGMAGRALLQAAAMTGPVSHPSDAGINAVPLNETAERIPPDENEGREQLLAGIDSSVRRLDASQAAGSVTTWRYLARAATIICDLDRHLLCMLRLRAEALGASDLVDPLWQTIRAMDPLAERWRALARRWLDLTAAHADPETGPAVDAGDLLVRLGRLAYDDPHWKPGHRARPENIDPAVLAPTREEFSTIGLTVIKTLDACNQIAAHHRDALNDVLRIRRLEGTISPAAKRPTEIRKLFMHYPANYNAGRAAITQLIDIMHKVSPEPEAKTALALRIAATPSPALLAGADCPHPLTDGALDGTAFRHFCAARRLDRPHQPGPRL
ncbi:hypothetical protein [Actinomadura gamaensis]|uniref:Uncharacterized protein n=1 Tax=Actinomadura gamaensis TaxID=1763541 RepID=A0ABV9TS37_9ACTN